MVKVDGVFTVGDYVLPKIQSWAEKGFIEPKRIFAINYRNMCANLGDEFNSCHLSNLIKVDKFIINPIHIGQVSLCFQSKIPGFFKFRFDKVYLNIGLN